MAERAIVPRPNRVRFWALWLAGAVVGATPVVILGVLCLLVPPLASGLVRLNGAWRRARAGRLPPGRRSVGEYLKEIQSERSGWSRVWPAPRRPPGWFTPLGGLDCAYLAMHVEDGRDVALELWDLRFLSRPRRALTHPVKPEGGYKSTHAFGYEQTYEGVAGEGPDAGDRQRWILAYDNA